MIVLEKVSFGYEKTPVLKEMSLRLMDGRVTALIGPNGAGKSTAIRVMAGLLRPASGTAQMDGQSLCAMERKALARKLAFLPQERPVPAISVAALVMHGRFPYLGGTRRPAAADHEAVRRALAMTGLTEDRERDLRTLSGGQRQKAYLAMLIAQDTPHMLLDEPFNHLDIGFQLEWASILRALAAEGRSICVVMHDLALLPSVCDEAVLVHEGKATSFSSAEACLWSQELQEAFHVCAVSRSGVAFLKKT